MLEGVNAELSAEPGRGLGRSFRRIGWLGFWTQIVVAVAPIIVFAVVYVAVRGFSLPGGRVGVLGWFSLLSMLVLAFTTWWSWRYRGIGRRIERSVDAPELPELSRTVWIGVAASAFGIVLSLVVILAEVIYLLVVFLEAPQGGAPVFQTVEGSALSWITALDVLTLLALTLTASAEILTLLLALWLVYRLSLHGEPSPAEASD